MSLWLYTESYKCGLQNNNIFNLLSIKKYATLRLLVAGDKQQFYFIARETNRFGLVPR